MPSSTSLPSSPTPTLPAQETTRALWNLTNSAQSSFSGLSSSIALAQGLHQAGLLAMDHPLDYSKNTFLHAMLGLALNHQQVLSATALQQFGAWNVEQGLPDEVHSRNKRGLSALDQLLAHPHRSSHDSKWESFSDLNTAIESIVYLVKHTPIDMLNAWAAPDPNGFDEVARREPRRLVEWLISTQAPPAVVLAVVDRLGVSLKDANDREGQSLMPQIRYVALLDRFLEEGGDLALSCTSRLPGQDHPTTAPLWQFLRARVYSDSEKEVVQRVEQWAETHAAEGIQAQRDAAYWKKFDAYSITAATTKHMKSNPEWVNMRDPEGRTPMMHLARGRPLDFKAFAGLKKAEAAIAAVDHEGRSLWAYFLANGKALGSANEARKWLVSTLPFRVDTKGRGLVAQALSASSRTSPNNPLASEHEVLLSADALWDAPDLHTTEAWMGSGAQAQRELGVLIQKHLYTDIHGKDGGSRFSKLLSHLAQCLDTQGLDPLLLGALWIACADSRYTSRFPLVGLGIERAKETSMDRCLRLIQDGARLLPQSELGSYVQKLLGPEALKKRPELQAMQELMELRALNGLSPASGTGGAKPAAKSSLRL